MTPIDEFNNADALLRKGVYDEASEIFLRLRRQYSTLEALCDYRLAAISNNTGDPMTAYDLYYRAFNTKPDIASILYNESNPSHSYVFKCMKEEKETTCCPLCSNTEITPKWCYSLTDALGYNSFFNPIRLWMYCEPCHHIVARNFPENLFIYDDEPRHPNPALFSYYSNVLSHIAQYTSGMSLFEVGIGGCECVLVAREIGFSICGIDVIDKHVQLARKEFGLSVETADFIKYQTERKYDIVIMGDVIEHVSDPVAALQKAYKLLNEDGVLWVSTPNFDSAFSIVVGHNDPMKMQTFHLNYFSRHSLFTLLERCAFVPVDYSISNHYNGSMEIIAIKAAKL